MATDAATPWIGRMRVLRKSPEPRPGIPSARILPLKGVRKRNAAALGWSFSHMPVHATAARAGWVPSSPGNIRSLGLPSRTMICAVIENQIASPQLKPSLIRMPVPYRSWATNDARLQKTEDANHFIRVSTTGKRRDGRGLPIS